MSANRLFFQPHAAWQQFWQARQPRERRALRLMLSMLGLAVLLQLGWWVFEERQRLQHRLPRLAQEAERVSALATRSLALKSREAESGGAAASAAAMLGRTQELNLEMGLALRAEAKPDGVVIVRGVSEAARWLQYVATVQATLHWQLVRCQLRGATSENGAAANDRPRIEIEAEFKAAEANE